MTHKSMDDDEHNSEVMEALIVATIECLKINIETAGLCPYCALNSIAFTSFLHILDMDKGVKHMTDEEIEDEIRSSLAKELRDTLAQSDAKNATTH